MANYNAFPMTYQPMYAQPQYQPYQAQMTPPQMQQVQQPAQQIQQPAQQYPVVQSGFVRVMNENEARMYPVAPGNSVTFINENSPYCYTKTVNMGQLDRPIFEKYRLVKEDDAPAPAEAPASQKTVEVPALDLSKYATKDDVNAFKSEFDLSGYATKGDVDAFKSEMEAFRADIEAFRNDLYGLAGKKKSSAKEA